MNLGKKKGYKNYEREIVIDVNHVLFQDIVLKEIDLAPVEIRSNPKGATVYIDNIEKGKTNLPLWLYPGDYDLKLAFSGYLDINKLITVEEGEINNFNNELIKNAAYLTISVQAKNAVIKINDKSYSAGRIELLPGKYHISVTKSGYLSKSEDIVLKLGQQINRSYTLTKNVGTLFLNLSPSNAKVFINKQDYGTQRSIELAPGTYKLEVKKEGWYSVEEILTLKLGEELRKSYTLKQKIGKLQFSVQPLEAQVTMKDASGRMFKSWTGMKYDKSVPVGEYEIECTYQGYKTKKQKITIIENQTKVVPLQMEEGTSYDNLSGMIFVEGGTFKMGSNNGDSNEKPMHTVTVSDYYMGKYEVTQELYQKIMGRNPSSFKGNNRPVEKVSWYDAVRFCNKLSEANSLQKVYTISGNNVTADFTKNGYRLPTEAEWEYAARGGNQSAAYTYSGSNTLGDVAWYSSNSGSKTHEVGTKQANELGLYDMSGNVWEWCWDWYGGYSSSSQTNPTGPSSGSGRVFRGGSWNYSVRYCRVAYRYGYSSYSLNYFGFRLALSSGS